MIAGPGMTGVRSARRAPAPFTLEQQICQRGRIAGARLGGVVSALKSKGFMGFRARERQPFRRMSTLLPPPARKKCSGLT